jgi:uncharacterized protein
MIVLDANILIYAYNRSAPQHQPAARWLQSLFEGNETIGLPWTTVWAFLRISTNPRLSPNPMPVELALDIVREWYSRPGVTPIGPGPRHLEYLTRIAVQNGVAGPLMSDAALAAIALEHGASLASADRDFARFEGLRWINPLPTSKQ